MSKKRSYKKGHVSKNGEVKRTDGMYMFRYMDCTGQRRTVYSWKLVDTDKLKEEHHCSQALRDIEKQIQKDLNDGVRTNAADHTTVDDLFEQFMELRKDLRESTRCCYNGIYKKHVQLFIK